MTDIFISYASLDRPAASRLAEALEACGWSVWWDYRRLRGGQHFERIIEEAISSARVVIVVWSENSIGSDWVRAEAALALDERKLVPLRIDRTVLPLRFRTIHTLDFSSWTGESEAEPFERLLETLSDYLGAPSPSKKTEQEDVAVIQAAYKRGAYATALSLARPAADQGNAAAQNWLGVMYEEGHGVAQDDAEAVRWYRKAADQGFAMAQANLGWMYENGRGVTQDAAEAVHWFRKAGDQGLAEAQTNLGLMYESGRGVAQDDAEAVRWYRKAADQGLAMAQNNLDRLAAKGKRWFSSWGG